MLMLALQKLYQDRMTRHFFDAFQSSISEENLQII